MGLTVGFDLSHKDDVGYNARKRMLVAGPTLMWDVPGFLNTSILWLRESNAPSGPFPPIATCMGDTPTTPTLFRRPTSAETNLDMALMYDIGPRRGYAKNKVRVGVGYQFWNNKFGNSRLTTGGAGQRASTPMVRADFHF